MNVPNALTLLRIFIVPLLVAALVQEDLSIRWNGTVWLTNDLFALTVFLIAAITDMLDGYLARKWGQITTVGTLLDPIADKLLISAALIALVQVRRIPAWIAILLIAREFAVSGLRSIAAAEGYTISASELGKTKMISQVAGVAAILLSIRWPQFTQFAMFCIWGAMLFSLMSAVDYFWKFWRKVDDKVKQRRRTELLLLDRRENRNPTI